MILSMASCAVLLLFCMLRGTLDVFAFVAIIVIGLVVFLLAFLIGYFLSQPLRSLNKKIKAYRSGDTTVDFTPDGTLYEADRLTDDFKDLLATSSAQARDLARREAQQAHFIGDVAHELRTPLTAIHGNAEMLADPDIPLELREKFSHTIMQETERLTRIANDLLSLQHIEEDAKAPQRMSALNLKPLVQEAVDSLAPILNECRAHVEITGEAPDVLGDRDRLKQVITNLVENASKFIQPQGHIRIELYGIKGNSVIAVKDDGSGFGNVDPKLLFERFYRTDESRARKTGGTGLGLSIVKSIVEAHDGTVEAYNLPEGGACFIVAIPSVGA